MTQDIALVERSAATFDSPPSSQPPSKDQEPQQCVLLRAGGHMSVLDMDQGSHRSSAFARCCLSK